MATGAGFVVALMGKHLVHPVVLEKNPGLDRSAVFQLISNHISSPIQLHAVVSLLVGHPYQGLVLFPIQGFIHGFDKGF